MKPLRIYVDTSVIGGCCDPEFQEDSWRLIKAVQDKRFILLLSDVVISELGGAPENVQTILPSLSPDQVRKVELTPEIFELQQAYLDASIIEHRWADDALHVAAATVARADALVSWNFKHIVRLDKMRAYNQINLLNGYGILTILSPKEVVSDEYDKE
jgi:predicted nucleic acid-binding protein